MLLRCVCISAKIILDKKRKGTALEMYQRLLREMQALISGHKIADLSNAAALIYNALSDLNWAGFYLKEGDILVLGPFQGKPACIEIPMGRGVCGTAAIMNETLVVENVHEFAGHIACDGASNSEIVIPLRVNGEVMGVLDIDSPIFSRFDDKDKAGLEELAKIIEKVL